MLFFIEEENVAYKFIEATPKEYDYCKRVTKKHFNKNLTMFAEEEEKEEKLQLRNSCRICEELFDVRDKKVINHCQRHRGTAHFSCNTNLKFSKTVPVIFNNLRGYDNKRNLIIKEIFHLIIKEISKFNEKISVIPNGLEKYMAFTVNKNLVFIESKQFMNSILDSLVKNLSSDDFKYLSEKGVYPYQYMDSFAKFSKNKLPDKCKFFSSLKDDCSSEKDYEGANNIWNAFKKNLMGDHHNLYLKADVLLLADVFEKFIKMCLDYYGLDPCHYFSSPGLSWNEMLKMTRIQL